MVDNNDPNRCSSNPGFKMDKEYEVCMDAILPRAYVGRFIFNDDDLKLYDFEKEYKTNKKTSYIAPCNGDSGSGQWVTVNQDTDDERRALVAVHSNMDGLEWNLNGKILSSVCGSATKFNTGKVHLESYLSTITTHDKILGFIKKWAGI